MTNWWDTAKGAQDSADAAVDASVHLTGTQEVDGVKTFDDSPIVPDPTTAQQAASKNYVDIDGSLVEILLTYSGTHFHSAVLTVEQAQSLIEGEVANVVVQSTTDLAHHHAVTVTWDGTNFQGSIATNHGHAFATPMNGAVDTIYSRRDPTHQSLSWGIGASSQTTLGDTGVGQLLFMTAGAGGYGFLIDDSVHQANVYGKDSITIEADGDLHSGKGTINLSGYYTLLTGILGLANMTKAARGALTAPPIGSAIFQTDNTPGLRVWNGTNWMRFTETAD